MVETLAPLVLAAAPSRGVFSGLAEFFQQGGPFMYVNMFWLACAVGVIAERIYRLFFSYHLNAGPFMEQVSKLVMAGNVERAVRLCSADQAKKTPLARIIRSGLWAAPRGEMEVAKAVEEAILENTPLVQNRLSWLWSIANIATLCGLIGTIIGLIGTFKALGNVPAEKKQELLSNGISEAMNNTAFGLSIAVICIVAHLFLTAYAKWMVEVLELNALKLENLLSRRSAGVTSAMDYEKSA
jgi:biopolymer transport protein ExbB/TolQ